MTRTSFPLLVCSKHGPVLKKALAIIQHSMGVGLSGSLVSMMSSNLGWLITGERGILTL